MAPPNKQQKIYHDVTGSSEWDQRLAKPWQTERAYDPNPDVTQDCIIYHSLQQGKLVIESRNPISISL